MPDPQKPWFLYILMDEAGKLYIGITQNLPERLAKHRRASGTMHTAKLSNIRLVYTEQHPTRQTAAAREKSLKHLPRAQKLALIQSTNPTFSPLTI